MSDLISKFPIKQQSNGDDCSVCVIWCILHYFGFKFSYKEVYNLVDPPNDLNKGITGEQITKILRKFDIKTISEDINISKLRLNTNNDYPIIVSMQYKKERNKKWRYTYKYGHYVVVLKVDDKKVRFMDPNYGKIKSLNIKEFKERWQDGDEKEICRNCAIICID